MKLKQQINPIRIELECTPEEFAEYKIGGYVDDSGGTRWQIDSRNEAEQTLRAVLCMTERVVLPIDPQGLRR